MRAVIDARSQQSTLHSSKQWRVQAFVTGVRRDTRLKGGPGVSPPENNRINHGLCFISLHNLLSFILKLERSALLPWKIFLRILSLFYDENFIGYLTVFSEWESLGVLPAKNFVNHSCI